MGLDRLARASATMENNLRVRPDCIFCSRVYAKRVCDVASCVLRGFVMAVMVMVTMMVMMMVMMLLMMMLAVVTHDQANSCCCA